MTKNSLHQIAGKKILADLQDQYLEALEEAQMIISHYEDIGNHQQESILEDWVFEELENVLEMVAFLGFDTFEEWFLDYVNSERISNNIFLIWTKELSKTYEEIISEELKKEK